MTSYAGMLDRRHDGSPLSGLAKFPFRSSAALLFLALCLPAQPSAQYAVPLERFRPKIKQVWSRNKEFVADVNFDVKTTKISRVKWQGNIGRSTLVWSMEGAFSAAWLADDGDHLVVGYEGGNLVPPNYDKDQVMLSFFRRGKIINQVRLSQLIADFSGLEKAGPNYRWVRYSGLNTCGHLVLETVEGRELLFDITTGQAPKLKPARAYRPAWKIHRDLLGCYEFQYPRDYLLKQERDNQGKPMRWISLKRERDQGWFIEANVEDLADYPRDDSGKTLAEFVFERAAGMYSADGPNGSTYATGMAQQRRFANRESLEVMEFYLNIVHETYSEEDGKTTTEKATVGPIYAVSIAAASEPYRVLFLRAFAGQAEDFAGGKEVLRQMADSVRRGLTAP